MPDKKPHAARRGRNLLAVILTLVITVGIVVVIVLLNRSERVEEAEAHNNTPLSSGWVTNGQVRSLAEDDTNRFVGGNFSYVGPYQLRGAVFDATPANGTYGDVDTSTPDFNNIVYASVSDGSGGWFVGGSFTSVSGTTRNRIAHIKPDGSLNADWDPDSNHYVYTLAMSDDNNTLYVGGNFSGVGSFGGENRDFVAAVDVTSTSSVTMSSWNPDASAYVRAIVPDNGSSQVFIGGNFTTMGGTARNRLAAVNDSTGALITTWDPNLNGIVYDLEISGTSLFVGGGFTTVAGGGTTRNRLAKYDKDTSSLSLDGSWDPDANLDVYDMATDGTNVYLGGNFYYLEGGVTYRNKLAAVRATGTGEATDWNPAHVGSAIRTLALDSANNRIYVGSDATTTVDTYEARELYTLDSTISAISPYSGPGSGNYLLDGVQGTDWTVQTVSYDGTDLFVGGQFYSAGGVIRHDIAKFSVATGAISSWELSTDPTSQIRALKISASGDYLYFGGEGNNRLGVASTSTGTWSTFSAPNGQIYSLDIDDDGSTLYVGGNFSSLGGNSRTKVASFDISTEGSPSINAWNPVANGYVNGIGVSGSGASAKVFLGGRFTNMDGDASLDYYAAIQGGSSDYGVGFYKLAGYDQGANTYGEVVHVDETGNVFVGGSFTTFAGDPNIDRLAKVSASTGQVDASWTPNPNGSIMAIDTWGDQVFVGGLFTDIDIGSGFSGGNVAALSKATAGVDDWAPTMSTWVYGINAANGKINVGGSFGSVTGDGVTESRRYLAQFTTTPVQYATLTQVSDTLTRLKKSTAADHTIQFKQPTGMDTPGDEIFVTLPSDFTHPSVDYQDMDLAYSTNDGCDTPGTWNNVTLAATSAAGVWGVDVTSLVVTFTAPSDSISIAAAKCIQIQIGTNASTGGAGVDQIVNPTTAGVYQIDFQWGSNSEIGATQVVILNEDTVTITANVDQVISFSISATAIEFGSLSSGAATYADASQGSASEVSGHNLLAFTNATTGYIMTVEGLTLTSQSADTITAIGGSAVASNPGTEQFGIRLSSSGGVGAATSPYASANYAYNATAVPVEVSSSTTPSDTTTYAVYYLANIDSLTESGAYTTGLRYITTGLF